MTTKIYDLIVVGGGLGGAEIAKAMAEHGARVLVLEAETQFSDRIRGEAMVSWGVAEARALEVYDAIVASGGRELRYWHSATRGRRDLITTTAPGTPVAAFYHPSVQEFLIEAAAQAGAEIRRGVRVRGIEPGETPKIVTWADGHRTELTARLIVGADGRNSMARSWAGFDVHRDPDHILVAGVLLDDVPAPEDAAYIWLNASLGVFALLFPQGHGRCRAYVCYLADQGYRQIIGSSRDTKSHR